mmetsp:Transcript_128225/g.227154  ORF Transcript_128225/g.227154 Transcript_128225/m.227154 type:complete len:205 (+) Transcript_128225:178-792(+)
MLHCTRIRIMQISKVESVPMILANIPTSLAARMAMQEWSTSRFHRRSLSASLTSYVMPGGFLGLLTATAALESLGGTKCGLRIQKFIGRRLPPYLRNVRPFLGSHILLVNVSKRQRRFELLAAAMKQSRRPCTSLPCRRREDTKKRRWKQRRWKQRKWNVLLWRNSITSLGILTTTSRIMPYLGVVNVGFHQDVHQDARPCGTL